MRTFLAIAAATLLLAACGEDGGDPLFPDDTGPARDGGPKADVFENRCVGVEFELGSGSREFEPTDSGDSVYLFKGPQAGYHLFLGVRAKGIDPNDVNVCWTFVFTSGPEIGKVFADKCWRARLTNDLGDGWHERVGIPGEVLPEYWNGLSYKIRGKDARVDVTINDTHGCGATDGWDVHIHEEFPR